MMMNDDGGATAGGDVEDDARAGENRGPPGEAGGREEGREAARGPGVPGGRPTVLRLLEQAREQRGSPPLWDAVAAHMDEEERRRDLAAPMLRLLEKIRGRVDEETWKLILDFEWRSSQDVVAGVEVGLELGYDHGRAAALVDGQDVPDAARVLTERLVDVIADARAGLLDVMLALVATLQTVVAMGRGEQGMGGVGLVSSPG